MLPTLSDALFLSTATAASSAVMVLLMRLFSERPCGRSKDSPASHLKLTEVVSRSRIFWLTLWCSLPFAFLFFILSVKSSTLVSAVRELLTGKVLEIFKHDSATKVESVLNSMPSWLDPIFILVLSLVLFAPYVRVPFDFFRVQVFALVGIDEDVDEEAETAAEAILKKFDQSYEGAKRELLKAVGTQDGPMPEELAVAPAVKRLAFQLLYFAKDDTQKYGLAAGLASLCTRLGATPSLKRRKNLPKLRHAFAALTIYAVLGAFYAFLAPAIAPWLHTELVRGLLQQVEWPLYSGELALSIVQRTLSFVVPLAAGISFFSVRRKDNLSESVLQTFAFVASIQFLFALLVNASFAVLFVAQRAVGETWGLPISLGSAKIWADAFMFSLTPCFALFSWLVAGRYNLGGIGSGAAVSFATALTFCACQFLFERLVKDITGFYWHQLVFGAFITASYGLSALIANDVLPTIGHAARTVQPQETASTV